MTTNTDPALWTVRPVHGVAGGPDYIVLTKEGQERAFAIGAQVRRGAPTQAFMALTALGGTGTLSERIGTSMRPTPLGHFHMEAWGVLQTLGYVERWYDASGDGVRLTTAGKAAAENGRAEQARLLERCKRAAST